MTLPKPEAKQLLERMIFDQSQPQEWVEDVWGLSPLLGESGSKLYEAFEALIECCSEEQLDNYLKTLFVERLRNAE